MRTLSALLLIVLVGCGSHEAPVQKVEVREIPIPAEVREVPVPAHPLIDYGARKVGETVADKLGDAAGRAIVRHAGKAILNKMLKRD